MLAIGKTNRLTVTKKLDFGFYLDGGTLGEILLPLREAPKQHCEVGEEVEAFIYYDSEDRIIATTRKPRAEVGQCAPMQVTQVGKFGAFLDWGLAKELLVPFKEQRVPMEAGRTYVVHVYLDNTGRIAASSRLSLFLEEQDFADFKAGQEVELLLASRSDYGYKAVINGTHLGLLHKNEIFKPVRTGDCLTGYVKSIREDDRIDLTLQKPGTQGRQELTEEILAHLRQQDGHSTLTDKSPPEEIYRIFNVSKASYKKALGQLYKEKRIALSKDEVRLL